MGSNDVDKRNNVLRRLYIATVLCFCFLLVEAVGGWLAGSLAILSDAAHLFADLAGFAVAIAASYLAALPATENHTFGLKRSESLAALLSMLSLAFASAGLAFEAIRRLIYGFDEGIDAKLMTIIASIGVVVNVILAFVLGEDHIHLPGAHDHDHSHDHGHHGGKSCGSHGDHTNHDDHGGHGDHNGHSHGHDHDDTEKAIPPPTVTNDAAHAHSHEHAAETHCSDSHEHSHDHQAETTCNSHDHDNHHGHHETDSLLGSRAHHEHKEHSTEKSSHAVSTRNVNLHAAYLHVLGDLAQSVAVLIAGLIVWWKPEWQILDPLITLLFSILVSFSTFNVLKSSIAVLLEATPANIPWQQMYTAISNVEGVSDVHDLHIWSISHGEPALTVHCKSTTNPNALSEIFRVCKKFGISHATIQVQTDDGECTTCEDHSHEQPHSDERPSRNSMCSSSGA